MSPRSIAALMSWAGRIPETRSGSPPIAGNDCWIARPGAFAPMASSRSRSPILD
jgi:hypothetical protein